uniref:Thioredoxin domain-containing protein n=1 Tax=Kalanchoe fedtschenkoi TaxID=63787 RepID=A0A7N1A7F6_KALFE
MGANESMAVRPEETGGELRKMTPNQCVPTGNEVIVFHSPAQWKHHFGAARDSNQLMVIDFTATWCGPCRFIEPHIKEFAAQYSDVVFIKIDVDELPMVAAEFGAQTLPAFVLIKKGRAIDRVVGVKVDELRTKIEKHRAQPHPL